MKASSKDFTSIVAILLRSGHVGQMMKLQKSVGNVLKGKHDYVWFPALQIVVHVDSNKVVQLRQQDGKWYYRRGRKNAWYDVSTRPGGESFADFISPHYTKFLNDTMMGDSDVAEPKGRSLQSGDSPQAR